jgi:hypothetical protein
MIQLIRTEIFRNYTTLNTLKGAVMKRSIKATFVGLCFVLLSVAEAKAGLIYSITESGGNVVVNISGSVNFDSTLGYEYASSDFRRAVFPSNGHIRINAYPEGQNRLLYVYAINSFFTPFGSGGETSFTSTTGDPFGLFNAGIGVSPNYLSGDPLSATGTINGATFASLGITPGTFVTSFSNPTSGVSDTVTVIAQVPEPCGLILGLTAGVAGLFVRRRR